MRVCVAARDAIVSVISATQYQRFVRAPRRHEEEALRTDFGARDVASFRGSRRRRMDDHRHVHASRHGLFAERDD